MLVSPAVEAEIIAHAREEAPKEACGLVIASAYVRCINVAEDPLTEFRIDDHVMAAAYASGQLVAVIHSHPDGPNSPTKVDMQQQQIGEVPWGICYINDERGHRPELFFWGDNLPIAPYEGRVFRHGIADCFALVRDWKRKEEGLILPFTPRDDEWWSKGQNVVEEGILAMPCEVVDDAPRIGDVLIAKIGSQVVNHTGVYVGNGLVLHHLSYRLSRIDVLGPWSRFVIKRVRTFPVQSVAQVA